MSRRTSLMELDMKNAALQGSPEQTMELLSDAWCSSAIQVFQPPVAFGDNAVMAFENNTTAMLPMRDKNSNANDGGLKSKPQWKFDDLKSWLWLQQAIHPEVDYDLRLRKKWFSTKLPPWNGISIKKWVKEMKQKRKEDGRLQRAEVHAAISVAGVAAALAAVAAESALPTKPNHSKETAVATAAALVAAQCAQVAEAVGAKREQLASAINAAVAATDVNNIITLTAAAATSLKGAATLRGRPARRERIKANTQTLPVDEFDFDFGRWKESLAKGDELLVETPDGKCRLRLVSVVLNKDAKVILKLKKINILRALSAAKESILYDLHASPLEEPLHEADTAYLIRMTTSEGKIKLKIDDYVRYKKWVMTINHMLMLSTTFSKYELQFYED